MQTIHVGMLGGGFMCKSHSNAYRTARYIFSDVGARAELTAICVRDHEKARALQEKYEFENAYTDINQLLEAGGIDLYDICTPAETHREIALCVIAKGKPLLCEKPLALTSGDAYAMLLAAESKGVQHYVGFNYRFLPAVILARKMLKEGVLGDPRHMRVRYFQSSGADADKPYESIRYVRTPQCGVLQEIGTHAIDQMRFLFGEMQSVQSMTAVYTPERVTLTGERRAVSTEDMAASLVSFSTGATGVMECGSAFFGQKNHLSWEIYGSEGSLAWNLEHPNDLCVYRKNPPAYGDGVTTLNVNGPGYPYGTYWWPNTHNIGWEHAQINMIAGVLENLVTGADTQPVATFLDGYRTAVIVEAIRESAETGSRIDLTPRYAK